MKKKSREKNSEKKLFSPVLHVDPAQRHRRQLVEHQRLQVHVVGPALRARVRDRDRHALSPSVAAPTRKLLALDALDLPAGPAGRARDRLEVLVRGREGAHLPEGVLVLGEVAVAAGALLGAVGGVGLRFRSFFFF
jgi:hypothetical protein